MDLAIARHQYLNIHDREEENSLMSGGHHIGAQKAEVGRIALAIPTTTKMTKTRIMMKVTLKTSTRYTIDGLYTSLAHLRMLLCAAGRGGRLWTPSVCPPS